jgi:hypothetical protein
MLDNNTYQKIYVESNKSCEHPASKMLLETKHKSKSISHRRVEYGGSIEVG